MARLYLFAEGRTEQTFADTQLTPHLAHYGVYLHKPVCVYTSRKKGRTYRGGGRNYLPMKNDVMRFLKQEPGNDVYFTTMIDLYGLYTDFPRLGEAEALRHVPYERVAFLEKAFREDIGDPRFHPYLQLHEYEAYIFSDLTGLQLFYDDATKIAHLRSISDSYESLELINDGPDTAPSETHHCSIP